MTERTLPPTEASLPDQPASLRAFWLAGLLGPIAYSIYFLLGYMLAEAACKADLLRFRFLGMAGLAATELLLTLLTAAIIGGGMVLTLRLWQRTAGQPLEQSAARFLAFCALWLNPFFILTTLVTGGALLFLQPCSWM